MNDQHSQLFRGRAFQRRGEAIKLSAAAQIHQLVSTVERKIWNVLLAHAYPRMQQEVFTISARELMDLVGMPRSQNYEYLKERLRNLVDTTVEWNLLGKDTRVWGVASLLAEAELKDGIVTYSFGARFKQRLANPNIFICLQLALMSEFRSEYALPLYELLLDYEFPEDGHVCRVPTMSIEELRRILGVEDGTYRSWKDFRRRVLEPAMQEIREHTDLEPEYICYKRGRTRGYTHIQFIAYRAGRLPERVDEVEEYLKRVSARQRRELIDAATARLNAFERELLTRRGPGAAGIRLRLYENVLQVLQQKQLKSSQD